MVCEFLEFSALRLIVNVRSTRDQWPWRLPESTGQFLNGGVHDRAASCCPICFHMTHHLFVYGFTEMPSVPTCGKPGHDSLQLLAA